MPTKLKAAEEELRVEVITVVDALAKEYSDVVEELAASGNKPQSTPAALRADVIFHLNRSGKYHSFKESLKRAVVRIVREKFERFGDESGDEKDGEGSS